MKILRIRMALGRIITALAMFTFLYGVGFRLVEEFNLLSIVPWFVLMSLSALVSPSLVEIGQVYRLEENTKRKGEISVNHKR